MNTPTNDVTPHARLRAFSMRGLSRSASPVDIPIGSVSALKKMSRVDTQEWSEHAAFESLTNIRNLPSGRVDQAELDAVLLNWGRVQPVPKSINAVPEPPSVTLIVLGILSAMLVARRAKRQHTSVSNGHRLSSEGAARHLAIAWGSLEKPAIMELVSSSVHPSQIKYPGSARAQRETPHPGIPERSR